MPSNQPKLLPSALSADARYQTSLPTPQYGFQKSEVLKSLFRIDDDQTISCDTFQLRHTWNAKVHHLFYPGIVPERIGGENVERIVSQQNGPRECEKV